MNWDLYFHAVGLRERKHLDSLLSYPLFKPPLELQNTFSTFKVPSEKETELLGGEEVSEQHQQQALSTQSTLHHVVNMHPSAGCQSRSK